MEINKQIAKALLNKSFAEAKEFVFKSLYAKASLALDEARFVVANSVFNEAAKTTGVPAGASEDKFTAARAEIKKAGHKAKLGKGVPAGSMKEEVDQLDEVSPPGMEKMTGSKKTKASFAKQYGKRGKSVMYATAWKLHNKKMSEGYGAPGTKEYGSFVNKVQDDFAKREKARSDAKKQQKADARKAKKSA
jgi:hypothetical protein